MNELHRNRHLAKPIFDASKVLPVKFSPHQGDCNTTNEVIIKQVSENIRRGLPQIKPHSENSGTALLVCGGPSLAMTEDELRDAYWEGGKIVAVNGAYQWCIDHNLKPSAAIMLDAREFNARFIETPAPHCRYLLASQCHPTAFELCKNRETLIWHAIGSGEDAETKLVMDYYFNCAFPVTLGTTVSIRAISLLRMLGFLKIETFGFDSCWLQDEHHSYDQAENDKDGRMSCWIRPHGHDDKAIRFLCAPWHIKQAEDFLSFVKERGDLVQLYVHGPGLIATMIRLGAEMSALDVPTAD